jgi:hypothetical protein
MSAVAEAQIVGIRREHLVRGLSVFEGHHIVESEALEDFRLRIEPLKNSSQNHESHKQFEES